MNVLIEHQSELTGNEQGIKQTLVAGAGNCEVPATAHTVGLQASVAGVRVRMGAAPAAAATKVGNPVLADLAAGAEIPSTQMEYYVLAKKQNRKLYFLGAAAEVITIVFFG